MWLSRQISVKNESVWRHPQPLTVIQVWVCFIESGLSLRVTGNKACWRSSSGKFIHKDGQWKVHGMFYMRVKTWIHLHSADVRSGKFVRRVKVLRKHVLDSPLQTWALLLLTADPIKATSDLSDAASHPQARRNRVKIMRKSATCNAEIGGRKDNCVPKPSELTSS